MAREPIDSSTWIFQSNPSLFDISAALAALDEMTWVARQNRRDMRPGDVVYIWAQRDL